MKPGLIPDETRRYYVILKRRDGQEELCAGAASDEAAQVQLSKTEPKLGFGGSLLEAHGGILL